MASMVWNYRSRFNVFNHHSLDLVNWSKTKSKWKYHSHTSCYAIRSRSRSTFCWAQTTGSPRRFQQLDLDLRQFIVGRRQCPALSRSRSRDYRIKLITTISTNSASKSKFTIDSGPVVSQHKSMSCVLKSRGVLRLSGPDTLPLLQGLVTNDVSRLENSPSVQYCMMLNVQGRVLYDLFLFNISRDSTLPPAILADVDTNVKEEILTLLRKYKLRKRVDISDVSGEYMVVSQLGQNKTRSHGDFKELTFHDPRVPLFGNRTILHQQALQDDEIFDEPAYRSLRFQWGIPEGVFDLPPGSCLPLESNLDLMNGVSFHKGCYIGQELTARTFHTGVTRKRLMPIVLEREADILTDSAIETEKGKKAGKFRCSDGKAALGLIRLALVKDTLYVIGNEEKIGLSVQVPTWWPIFGTPKESTS